MTAMEAHMPHTHKRTKKGHMWDVGHGTGRQVAISRVSSLAPSRRWKRNQVKCALLEDVAATRCLLLQPRLTSVPIRQ